MKKIGKEIAWIGLYIVVFILIQLVIQFAFAGGYLVYYKMPLANFVNDSFYHCLKPYNNICFLEERLGVALS